MAKFLVEDSGWLILKQWSSHNSVAWDSTCGSLAS